MLHPRQFILVRAVADVYNFVLLHVRVVGALVLRETRVRFGQSQLGYLWALLEPISYIAVFSTIFTFMDRHPPVGNDMALYFATGILAFHHFRNISTNVAGAFGANRALLNYPIVKPIHTIMARSVLETATSLFVMIIVIGALVFGFGSAQPHDLSSIMVVLFYITILGSAVGLLNAVIIERIASWQNVFRMAMVPMVFISGVFYSIQSVPRSVKEYLLWNPVLHGVELFRAAYYSNYRASGVDLLYLAAFGLLVLLLGLGGERLLRRSGND